MGCWVMISEIFPLQIRSRGMAVSTCVNRATAGIVALFFLSIKDVLTPIGTWIMFGCLSVLAIIFVYKYVPETKNKTLEEITNSLLYGVKHFSVPDMEIGSTDFDEQLSKDEGSNKTLEMVNYDT